MTTSRDSRAIVVLADSIAVEAHEGQTDKLGVDYIAHPRSVARRVDQDDEIAVAGALLHDVVEDSGLSAADLLERGMPTAVVDVVTLLTRDKSVSDEDYYAAIKNHPRALQVKLADLADNNDPDRVSRLPEALQQKLRAKYEKAYRALGRDDLADEMKN
ncbi:HD domain-containing protein [Williamsia sp. M5A3_1d]